jgi:hypothetical protein
MSKKVYVVKQTQLADGSILQSIIATQPGAKKMQFPYELPTVTVALDNETKTALYTTAGILAGGYVTAKLITALL